MKKKTLKNSLSIALTAVLAASMSLTGCGSSGGASSSVAPSSSATPASSSSAAASSSSQAAAGPKTQMTLTCLVGGNNQAYADELQILIDKFNAGNTYNVELKMEGYANEQYKTKLTTLMASNAQPDIFYTWEAGFLKPFVEGGKVYPIGDKFEADAEWNGRFPDKSVFGPLTYDDKIYGMPNTRQICIISYNKNMFKEAGVDVPKTYDDFIKVCDALKAKSITPLAIPCKEAWYGGQFLQQLANGVGGEALYNGICDGSKTWEDSSFVEAGTMLADIVKKGYLTSDYLGMSPNEGFDALNNEKIAMFYHITSGLNVLENPQTPVYDHLGFFRLPPKNPDNAGVNVGSIGQTYAVSSKAANIDGACEFIKQMSVDYQKVLGEKLGQVLVTNTPYDESKVAPLSKVVIPMFKDVTLYTPWFDRIFGAGEGVELNNAAVAIMAGGDPVESMKNLQQFAIDNATR